MNGITPWLLSPDSPRPADDLIAALAEKLLEVGVPIWRINTSLLTLHSEVYVQNVLWTRGEGVKLNSRGHDIRRSPSYVGSSVELLHNGSGPIRERLDKPSRFGPVEELRAKGATDYFILPVDFTNGRRSYISYFSDSQDGFSDVHLAMLQEVLPALALRLELCSAYFATESLLQMYLGRSAATRVLDGQFLRGGGERIEAAIWFCDLRGFTSLTEQQPVEDVLTLLDQYFECTAGAISEAGGEVLKFIGDAVLGIFPVEGSRQRTCARALAAARAALARIDAFNVAGPKLPIEAGIALHLGEVMFGNIGAKDRLDFTVIGPAVNEAARLESLCKPLQRRLVVSKTFADASGEALPSLGSHALKGVAAHAEIFSGEHP